MKAHSHTNTIPGQRDLLWAKEMHRTHHNISPCVFVSLLVFRQYSYKDKGTLDYGDN
jgi:hypothetical protein